MSGKRQAIAATAGMAGAALMYLLDPSMGRRRRAGLRDKAIHFSKAGMHTARLMGRDTFHRLQGLWAETTHGFKKHELVSDDILVERVRSQLGRGLSHASSIKVSANDGCVVLRGSILENERNRLLRRVRSIRGVKSVDDQLESA